MDGWTNNRARLHQWTKMRYSPTVTRWHHGSPDSTMPEPPGAKTETLCGTSITSKFGKFQSLEELAEV